MNYKYLGKFMGEAPKTMQEAVGDIFIQKDGLTHYFHEWKEDATYELRGSILCPTPCDERAAFNPILLKKNLQNISISEKYIFVSYSKFLEVMDFSGKLLKVFKGRDFILKNGVFLVMSSVSYVVDGDASTAFVKYHPDILDFSASGDILYQTDHFCYAPGKSFSVSSCDAGDGMTAGVAEANDPATGNFIRNSSPAENPEVSQNKFLVIESLKNKRVFYAESQPVFAMENIAVFEEHASIENPICADSFYIEEIPAAMGLESKSSEPVESLAELKSITRPNTETARATTLCRIVLCPNEIFLLCKNYIVRKKIEHSCHKIIPKRFVIHNYLEQIDFYDMIIALSLFLDLHLLHPGKAEQFLLRLILSRKPLDRLVKLLRQNHAYILAHKNTCCVKTENIFSFPTGNTSTLHSAKQFSAESIICRTYRRVDDRAKALLDQYLNVSLLSSDDFYYIIIYKLNYIDQFIKKCIQEKRLFYLKELVQFYVKIGRIEELRVAFLRNDLMILKYAGMERMQECEDEEIESQRCAYYCRRCIHGCVIG